MRSVEILYGLLVSCGIFSPPVYGYNSRRQLQNIPCRIDGVVVVIVVVTRDVVSPTIPSIS
jgi:hypothetical protein